MSFDIREFQAEHKAWLERNFPGQHTYENRHQAFLGVVEEVGELAHTVLKSEQKIREFMAGDMDGGDTVDTTILLRATIADGVGDLVIFLAGFCDMYDLDLETCIEETWKRVRQRDWVADPTTGGE